MHRPIRAVALACAATLVPAAAAQAAPPPADSVIVTLKPGTPGAAARDACPPAARSAGSTARRPASCAFPTPPRRLSACAAT